MSNSRSDNCLVIVDPEPDFCSPKGALHVPGAEKDVQRVADLIKNRGRIFSKIRVTLDTHHPMHIAHPIFWKGQDGNSPPPFTTITVDDVESGKWTPFHYSLMDYALEYVKTLKANNRYQLTIWPPHCLIGSPGSTVMPELFNELVAWEVAHKAIVDYTGKGSNWKTEHYSPLVADVPDPEDPSTGLNVGFIQDVMQFKNIYCTGWALSHCLGNFLYDLANAFGDDSLVQKIILVQDATSSVGGFEHLGEKCIQEMTARGMRLVNAGDI